MTEEHPTSLPSANAELHDAIQRRAKELFQEQQRSIFESTDRLFAGLMLAQWIGAIFTALYISPKTWAGSYSQTHIHVWAAILVGGAISSLPIYLALVHTGEAITRHVIAAAQILMSGLLIHLTGGRIETHFHIFGSLAFLAFYRDWRVLIPATVVAFFDHFLRGALWPESIYGVLTSNPWRSIEHVGWVAFEDIFLVGLSLRSLREMRAIAWHTAQLETTNHVIEEKVIERTAEVKASEERFRLLMDGVKDYAIIMLDPQGHVVSWNEGAKRVSGYLAEDILGKHFSILHPEEDREQGKPDADLQTAATFGRLEEEGWRVRQDGSQFWANVVLTALFDDEGELRGFSKVTRDATLRKQAEENLLRANDELEHRVQQRTAELAQTNAALQAEIIGHQQAEAEIRLQNTLLAAQGEAAIEGILVVSAQGQISSVNQRFIELWDVQNNNWINRPSEEFLYTILKNVMDADSLQARIVALAESETAKGHGQVSLIDGKIFDYYSAPLKGADGTFYGRIWFIRDVTEETKAAEVLRVAKEEAENANAAKSHFLSRMSHELRTPMNAILGFGQILQWDDLTPDQGQSVDQILKGGRHLLGLINEVLQISKIEAGHMSLSLEPVSLGTVLSEAIDLVKPIATQSKVLLDARRLDAIPFVVMADQQRLKQVILNLLSNAIKYNRSEGKVSISTEVREGNRLRLLISDTGNGISPQNLEKLFVPFERLGAENSGIDGNGIGLALSKQLMSLMGGEIGVASDVGQGSTFWIELALAQQADVSQLLDNSMTMDYQTQALQHLKPTILYIEDNLSNLSLVESILRRHFDIEVLSAMQGSLGLQLAREHQPDLILLDLHLPDIMGDKVLSQLQTDDETGSIPVIMLSADATERQIQKLLDAGARDYLTKPLDVNQFLRVLEENLKERDEALMS